MSNESPNLMSNDAALKRMRKIGNGTSVGRVQHYPRWDKKMKHIVSERKKGLL